MCDVRTGRIACTTPNGDPCQRRDQVKALFFSLAQVKPHDLFSRRPLTVCLTSNRSVARRPLTTCPQSIPRHHKLERTPAFEPSVIQNNHHPRSLRDSSQFTDPPNRMKHKAIRKRSAQTIHGTSFIQSLDERLCAGWLGRHF